MSTKLNVRVEWDGVTIGSCGGDAFGTNAWCAVYVNGKFYGALVRTWNDTWWGLEIGEYPNEKYLDLRARTVNGVLKKLKAHLREVFDFPRCNLVVEEEG